MTSLLLSTGDIIVLTTGIIVAAWMLLLVIKMHQLQTSLKYGDGEWRSRCASKVHARPRYPSGGRWCDCDGGSANVPPQAFWRMGGLPWTRWT